VDDCVVYEEYQLLIPKTATTVQNLSHSIVFLDHLELNVLYLKNLKFCILVCGSVKGSIFLDNLSNCTLAVTAGQLRMHNSTGTDVFCSLASTAIIEDCTKIGFSKNPYVNVPLIKIGLYRSSCSRF
jgi:hypothetical protein